MWESCYLTKKSKRNFIKKNTAKWSVFIKWGDDRWIDWSYLWLSVSGENASWNASSVVFPLILWLCDITLCHWVTRCRIYALRLVRHIKYLLSTAALLVSGAGSGMFGLTNQTEHLKQRGRYGAAKLDRMRELMCFLSINERKSILVVTQNKID